MNDDRGKENRDENRDVRRIEKIRITVIVRFTLDKIRKVRNMHLDN